MIIGLTGGMGLIGKALRQKLEAPVVLLVRHYSENSLKKNETIVAGNFSDENVSELFTSGLDVLIHAATGVGPRSEFEDRFIHDDLVGTIKLAKKFFAKNPSGHFIYLSTAGGLYDLENLEVKTEESDVYPKVLYGAIKLIIEEALSHLHGQVSVLRPSAIYGDALRENQTVGLIDKLLKTTFSEVESTPVPLFDKMDSARDYLHVEDLVAAIVKIIEKPGESLFEIYNVGTGTETSIEVVINLITNISENPVRVEFLPTPNKRTSLIVNSDKMFKQTGWKSKISLKEGILKMYQGLNNKE